LNKTVLITGATGMVGSEILNLLLNDPAVQKVIPTGRRNTGIKNEKLQEIIHDNFLNFSVLSSHLTHIDACHYCPGVYQTQVSKEKFFEITCD